MAHPGTRLHIIATSRLPSPKRLQGRLQSPCATLAVPQTTDGRKRASNVGDQLISDMLATWRRNEQAMESGLNPDLAKRLDDLRAEDARLLARSPRHRSVRMVESGPMTTDVTLRRTG